MSKYVGTYYDRKKNARTKRKRILHYDDNLGGYTVERDIEPYKLYIGSKEDYYRYVAGERKHIVQDYNPEIMNISTLPIEDAPDKNEIIFLIERVEGVEKSTIPNGIYHIVMTRGGPVLKEFKINSDKYINFRRKNAVIIEEELRTFIKNKNLYEAEGASHREGLLLFGPPGNGKTMEIKRTISNAKTDGFLTIFVPSQFHYISDMEPLRSALEGRTVVFVFEEITERTSRRGAMEELLSFLDGEMSWNNSFTIATTNYPEMLPKNIVDRPGRFDFVIKFDNPTKEERLNYLLGRNVTEEEAKKVADETEGLSLDYIAQSVTQSRIKKVKLSSYIKLINKNREIITGEFSNKQAMGIASQLQEATMPNDEETEELIKKYGID